MRSDKDLKIFLRISFPKVVIIGQAGRVVHSGATFPDPID